MRVMNDLIDAALGAEFTRRKIFSATGAFHKNSRIAADKKRSGAAHDGSAKLDDRGKAPVVLSALVLRSGGNSECSAPFPGEWIVSCCSARPARAAAMVC